MKIGIIGDGRFGSLTQSILSTHFETVVCKEGEPLSKMSSCDVIIPCVPINQFEQVIKDLSPFLHNNLVIDVCSVKEHPIRIMKTILPKSVQIIGSHPMFGPDSAKMGVEGKKIVLTQVRCTDATFQSVQEFLTSLGLEIVLMTAEEHDKSIAHSQVLVHLLGRSFHEMELDYTPINTEGFRRLLSIMEITCNDSWQLFEDMNKYNRFSQEAREKLQQAIKNVEKKIE